MRQLQDLVISLSNYITSIASTLESLAEASRAQSEQIFLLKRRVAELEKKASK